jgi:hypothetical protein
LVFSKRTSVMTLPGGAMAAVLAFDVVTVTVVSVPAAAAAVVVVPAGSAVTLVFGPGVAVAAVTGSLVVVPTDGAVTVPEDRSAVVSDWLWLPPPQPASAVRQSMVDSALAAGVCSVDFMAISSGDRVA